MRIIHVDNLPRGQSATSRMLEAGVSAYNKGLASGETQVDLCGETFDVYDQDSIISDPQTTVFAITVAERDLSIHTRGRPCPSRAIRTAYEIAANRPGTRVFLVPTSRAGVLTGVDAVIAMLVGISGIVDDRGLVFHEVIHSMITPAATSRRQKSISLVGEVASRIEVTKKMLTAWSMDDQGDPTLDGACWRAAMALAELDSLEPLLVGPQPFSFSSLAAALNLSASVTNFRLNENDLRRVLSTLARRWLPPGHRASERRRLPDCARENGMPRHRPLLPNNDCAQTDRRTLAALMTADIVSQPDLDQMPQRIVRLANFSGRNKGY